MSNKSFLRPAFWLLFCYFLEVTLAGRLGAFAPPLVLAAVIGTALERGPLAGFASGAAAGLLFEPFAGGAFGAVSAGYALAGYASGALTSKFFGESVWVRTIWPCAALAAASAVEAAGSLPPDSGVFWEMWFSMLTPSRLLSMALAAPLVTAAMRFRPVVRRPRPIFR